jgi:hypothetical protein
VERLYNFLEFPDCHLVAVASESSSAASAGAGGEFNRPEFFVIVRVSVVICPANGVVFHCAAFVVIEVAVFADEGFVVDELRHFVSRFSVEL